MYCLLKAMVLWRALPKHHLLPAKKKFYLIYYLLHDNHLLELLCEIEEEDIPPHPVGRDQAI